MPQASPMNWMMISFSIMLMINLHQLFFNNTSIKNNKELIYVKLYPRKW